MPQGQHDPVWWTAVEAVQEHATRRLVHRQDGEVTAEEEQRTAS